MGVSASTLGDSRAWWPGLPGEGSGLGFPRAVLAEEGLPRVVLTPRAFSGLHFPGLPIPSPSRTLTRLQNPRNTKATCSPGPRPPGPDEDQLSTHSAGESTQGRSPGPPPWHQAHASRCKKSCWPSGTGGQFPVISEAEREDLEGPGCQKGPHRHVRKQFQRESACRSPTGSPALDGVCRLTGAVCLCERLGWGQLSDERGAMGPP